MANNIVAGMDIGTNKIVVLIGEIEEENIKVIGVGKVKTNAVNNSGFITNVDELKNKINLAIEEAERMADTSVDAVYLNLFGKNIKCSIEKAGINIKNPEKGITREDLVRVMETVKEGLDVPERYSIVHMLVRQFIVDNMTGIKDPIGMSASILEAEVYVVMAPENIMLNMEKCVNELGYEVKDFVFEPLASAEAVLTEDEKNMGTLVIDFGANYTNISVYSGGTIEYSKMIPIGSSTVTNDIAIVLHTSFEEAERLKLKYANIYAMEDENEKIEVFDTSKENVKIVTKKYINEIIFARIEEILKIIFEDLNEKNMFEKIKSGIVITGGGAQIEGLTLFVEHLFDLSCRLGKPLNLKGLFDKINSPVYSTSIGLLKYAKKSIESGIGGEDNIFKKFLNKLRDFFDTYF